MIAPVTAATCSCSTNGSATPVSASVTSCPSAFAWAMTSLNGADSQAKICG
jgi:hypothetical protein